MICKTCRFIEHGIYFKQISENTLTIKHCCNMDALPEDEQPHLLKEYKGGSMDWNEIFTQKRKDRERFRKGEYYDICKTCWELQEQETDEEDYFSHITLANIRKCNSRCVYCYSEENKKIYSEEQKFRLLPVIKEMQENNLLKFTGSLRFMGGEPTLLKDFEEITNLFTENNISEIYLPTSGIRLSKAMINAVSKIYECNIFISIDSGCKETYKKIKGINAYDKVLNSLKEYVSKSRCKEHIISKYILVRGINDNTKEIEKWISESKKTGIRTLALDVERLDAYDNTREKYYKYLSELRNYAEKRITEEGMIFSPYCPYLQKLKSWYDCNKDKLENDISDKTIEINTDTTKPSDAENIINNLINEYSIWNKPVISLTSKKETTKSKYFNEIISILRKTGFKVILNTDCGNYSEELTETLILGNVKLNVSKKGKHYDKYCNICGKNSAIKEISAD